MRKLLDVRTESPGNNLILTEKNSTNTVNTTEVEEDTEFSSGQNAGNTDISALPDESRTATDKQDNEDQYKQQVKSLSNNSYFIKSLFFQYLNLLLFRLVLLMWKIF